MTALLTLLSPLLAISTGVNYSERKQNLKHHRPTATNTFWVRTSSMLLLTGLVTASIYLVR